MKDDLGAHRFTYAVITDTHLNQGETECNSPFEVNRLANGRMRHVVRDLNARDLAFVIHLGDLLHPVPAIEALYERAAAQFNDQIAALRHPIYLIPGNHDVGDKPIDWGPAGVVRDEFLALWRQHFGPNYQAFEHDGCRFVLIDAQIINSGLEAEAQQRTWLEAELAAHEGRRVFLNLHYPPYLTDPHEEEHYDNLAEPGRSWVLDLMRRYRIEAMFAGHVHNFWYHRHGESDCYLLPSTAFVRQDYAEMFRVAPGPHMQAGRNDANKLGFFVVHVHERGHLCEMVRTYGTIVEPGSAVPEPPRRVAPIHPRQNPSSRFGFDMRQSWLELIEIPPSGGLDEFDRKQTRNDYGLMAMMEMGVRRLRIPPRDLLDAERRARLAACHAQGLRFTLFSFGVPGAALADALHALAGVVDTWEVAHRWDQLPAAAAAAAPIANAAGIALYLSKLRSQDDIQGSGEKYYHMINHGFTAADAAQLDALAEFEGITGAVFRVPGEMSPWAAAREAAALVRARGLSASLHVRMSIGSPGDPPAADAWVTRRAIEALAASAAHSDVHVTLDAFADIDRGYFVRPGVVDRHFNPRPAFHAVRHLNAVLAREANAHGVVPAADGEGSAERGEVVLLGESARIELIIEPEPGQGQDQRTGQHIDLLSGRISAGPETTGSARPGPRLVIAARP